MDSVPEILTDDPQVRHLSIFPILARLHTADALAGSWIEHHPHPVPNKNAGIDGIAKDAVTPIGAAVQGRGVPLCAPRRQDTFCVEIVGDLPRGSPLCILMENPPDHISFVLFNLKLARFSKDRGVAIGLAASAQPFADVSNHTTMNLFTEILEEQRAHKAAHANLYLALHTFVG
ncbi:hypothetical protein NHG85_04450 [Limimaricola sp. ASW11-118]|uniref:Uncharacterized protein n=1 Tax=Limimaricola litoreus TaxID=2955316 RepID=A0A9X2FMM7_9RHOB|nr:hypothetical protein [Limimaricola litoreus]MCP1167782.1 hypothetical protein [Limimaricola litoreus]